MVFFYLIEICHVPVKNPYPTIPNRIIGGQLSGQSYIPLLKRPENPCQVHSAMTNDDNGSIC